MNRKSGGNFLILLGLSLILAASALLAYNIWDEKRAGETADAVLVQLVENIPQATQPAETTPQTPTTEVEYPDYILDPTMDMPIQNVGGFDYIGVVEIPGISLELPVISQWSEEGAKIAPCRYSGSAYLDDMVIAAHNYAPHFGNLPDVRLDDEVLFTDMDGNQFRYRVVEFEVLQPTQIEDMVTGDWDLTLFTCTVGGQTRVTVRCEKYE